MHQNAVTCGPVKADMDRCAEAPGRMPQGNETAPPTSEASHFSSCLPLSTEKAFLSLQINQLEKKVSELEHLVSVACPSQHFFQAFSGVLNMLSIFPAHILIPADGFSDFLLSIQERIHSACMTYYNHTAASADTMVEQPFREVCSAFFTRGKITSPKYLFAAHKQADILVGIPLPDYPTCGISEIDALARYHGCLGRILPFLKEDLHQSFRSICQGLIIGEGHDVDAERILGILKSLDKLHSVAEANGNALLREMVLSFFCILDTTLIGAEQEFCFRRFCFEYNHANLLLACYPADVGLMDISVREMLIQRLDDHTIREGNMCRLCSNPYCPIRSYFESRCDDIRAAGKPCHEKEKSGKQKEIKPLTEQQKKDIHPFLMELRKAGLLDDNNHWVKKKNYKKAHAGWVARIICNNVSGITQLQIGELLGVSYILKAAAEADGDDRVCDHMEAIFREAKIQFTPPPRIQISKVGRGRASQKEKVMPE